MITSNQMCHYAVRVYSSKISTSTDDCFGRCVQYIGPMIRLSKMKYKAARLVVVAGLVLTGALMSTPAASATNPADAPPGYGGPVSSCGGTLIDGYYLATGSGSTQGSLLNIYYSTSGSGTFCAMTFDNLSGSHHMEVVVRRGDWTTNWYDSGTYNTFAGGIQVFGAAGKCVYFFGRVTNGVNYEVAVGLIGGTGAVCYGPIYG